MVLGSLERARTQAPLSTREERELRRRLAGELGDGALADRLDEMELYYRLGLSVRNLRSSAARIASHVKSLRSYARADREKRTDVSIEEGLEESLMLLNHKLGDIELVRGYSTVPVVTGFAGELNQVWTNLLSNAIQAMAGAGTLTVATSTPDPDHVQATITDTGPGIPEDDLARIFDLHFTTKEGRVEFGLGLGLTITRDIVERHHGTIEVTSRPGMTTFRVTLPVAGVDAIEQPMRD